MRSTLKLAWQGVTGLGWLALLAVVGPPLMSVESLDQPSADGPARNRPEIASDATERPTRRRPDADLVQVDRREARPRVQILFPEPPEVGRAAPARRAEGRAAPRHRAAPAPNLHETHRPGEPYPYSEARYRNNELRWTINEFRWRLGDPHVARPYWDLSDIDEPLDGDLPERLDDLRAQNWELAWRAQQLHRLLAGLEPAEVSPPMPTRWTDVSIPVPT
jgi:hypothetical protein